LQDWLQVTLSGTGQGCQVVYFQTKNPNLSKFWRALDWKMLVCCYVHLVHFVLIWCSFFPVLVTCTKKNLATLAQAFFEKPKWRYKKWLFSDPTGICKFLTEELAGSH
jgi:hypothetical protein